MTKKKPAKVKKPAKKPISVKTTINLKKICKESTELNIGGAFVSEMKFFFEENLIPAMVKMGEEYAREAGRKTLVENDLVRSKDFVWYYVNMITKGWQ